MIPDWANGAGVGSVTGAPPRALSIAGGVSFFILLAIFPAITAMVSAYALFFNASTIINNLSLLNDVVPDNVLSIVHEQAARIASNSSPALSIRA